MRITVKVPASSANLGCGFDAFGLALALYNDFVFDTELEPGSVVAHGLGAERLQAEGCSLLFAAVQQYQQHTGVLVPPFGVEVTAHIPLGRGLGSSSTAIVGGLLGANALCQAAYPEAKLPSQLDLAHLATAMEGHPDNVTPAMLGGMVVAISACAGEGDLLMASLPLPPDLTTVVFIPEFEMPTKEARAVLPQQIALGDAVHNASRTALFVAAFTTGNLRWLREAMNDRLHQPYRAAIFPPLPSLINAAQSAGAYGAALSGAGSTVLALTNRANVTAVLSALTATAETLNLPGQAHELAIAVDGSLVEA